jgi:hypothetical protein
LRCAPLVNIKTRLEKSTLTMIKHEEVVLVLLTFMFWQFEPIHSLYHNVFRHISNLAGVDGQLISKATLA